MNNRNPKSGSIPRNPYKNVASLGTKHPRILLIFGFGSIVTSLLHYRLISQASQYYSHGEIEEYMSFPMTTPVGHRQKQKKIRIFYNIYIKSPDDEDRVTAMFAEQLRYMDPEVHISNVALNSIGHQPSASSIPNATISEHHKEGSEGVTLHSLWKYCQANNNDDTKVVYLHSKGSFHPDENNNKLRRFLTEGALSPECANLPNNCNICSSRMSTHPHPHTSGNMWLARCSYVAKLLDPYALKEGKLPSAFSVDNGCKAFGRYFFEGWAYSHPSVQPCDLYPGKEFTFAYENIPAVNFTKNLMEAPRFGFEVFVDLLLRNYFYCREDRDSHTPEKYLKSRIWSYKNLYNTTVLDRSWFLWTYLHGNSTKTNVTF